MAKKLEPVAETTVEVQKPLGLNLELGRQDLNDNFRKIEEAINELRK